MLEIGMALALGGLGILATAAFASNNSVVRWISPTVAYVLSALLIVGGFTVIFWPNDSGSDSVALPSPAVSGDSEGLPTVSRSGGVKDLDPSPELNQTVTIGGTPTQGHTYLLTAAGCPGSEVRAESHVTSNTAKLGLEVALADDAFPETRVKVSISQSEKQVAEMDLNQLDPVTVAVGLDEGSFTLAFTSLNGSSNECADTEFTVLLRNYVLSEG